MKYISLVLFSLLVMASCTTPQAPAPQAQEQAMMGLMLSEAQMQLANIHVATVATGEISREIVLTGVIKVDEESVSTVTARVPGRIEKLHFKNTGELVNKGDALYDFYSEDMLAVMREYKNLQDNNWNSVRRSGASIAAENRLLLMGMLPSQIAELYNVRQLPTVVTIHSPGSGLIRSVKITEGQYVVDGQQLFDLADDSRLWVEAQVYPNELQLLKTGMVADVIIPAAQEMMIRNRISFINPAFEPGTNVTMIRSIINNPGKELHPGMLALIRIHTEQSTGIVIPVSSMLMDKKGSFVWIQQEDGSFVSRRITTGIQSTDSVLVVSGLEESEQIVISGAYLLNSEKILNGGAKTTEVAEM